MRKIEKNKNMYQIGGEKQAWRSKTRRKSTFSNLWCVQQSRSAKRSQFSTESRSPEGDKEEEHKYNILRFAPPWCDSQ